MGTLGWVVLAAAFLLFFMVANNSWPYVWNKIRGGIPQEGEGNRIVPVPDVVGDPNSILQPGGEQPEPAYPGEGEGNRIVPVPDSPGTIEDPSMDPDIKFLP